MATMRIEFVAGHQVMSCEACNFGVLSSMGHKCRRCGVRFEHLRLVGADGRELCIFHLRNSGIGI